MSCVLIVQCLVFQDGGLIALGANIFNMGVVAIFISYFTYRVIFALARHSKAGRLLGAGIAGWLSVVASALFCACELSLSGTSPWAMAVPAMGIIHLIIGVGEGLITVAVLALVMSTRADLLELQAA